MSKNVKLVNSVTTCFNAIMGQYQKRLSKKSGIAGSNAQEVTHTFFFLKHIIKSTLQVQILNLSSIDFPGIFKT